MTVPVLGADQNGLGGLLLVSAKKVRHHSYWTVFSKICFHPQFPIPLLKNDVFSHFCFKQPHGKYRQKKRVIPPALIFPQKISKIKKIKKGFREKEQTRHSPDLSKTPQRTKIWGSLTKKEFDLNKFI
jgi:hypothetical protein